VKFYCRFGFSRTVTAEAEPTYADTPPFAAGLFIFSSIIAGFMSKESYNADAIEVLRGLEPVRKRPGMYTQTERPNHLAQEVIDNSVDEAIAGYASKLDVVLFKDGSVQVSDDGRGMPVDKHKGEKISGVEVVLTRLHAGGKFSNKNYPIKITSFPVACTAWACRWLMRCRNIWKYGLSAMAKSTTWPLPTASASRNWKK